MYCIYHSLMCNSIGSVCIIRTPIVLVIVWIAVSCIHSFRSFEFERIPIWLSAIGYNVVSGCWHAFTVVSWRVCLLPNNIAYKAILAKYFIHHQAERGLFVVITRNKDDSVRTEHSAHQHQTRVHHAEPLVMTRQVFSLLSYHFVNPFASTWVVAVVCIRPFLACVIRWVVIDTFHPSLQSWQQCFQTQQVVAVNNHITAFTRQSFLSPVFCRIAIRQSQRVKRHLRVVRHHIILSYPI